MSGNLPPAVRRQPQAPVRMGENSGNVSCETILGCALRGVSGSYPVAMAAYRLIGAGIFAAYALLLKPYENIRTRIKSPAGTFKLPAV